jgi:uncharacterized protein YegL
LSVPFDVSKFTVVKAKPLPVILLLDTSGSMGGQKIDALNQAVDEMITAFQGAGDSETEIDVAVITFGRDVALRQPLTSVADVRWSGLSAAGGTPMGTAIAMAKAMIEDKEVIPARAYRPTVVLVSDGQPTDSWEEPLDAFIGEGRSSKCDRMAMAIGHDADETVLGKFIQGTEYPLFYAKDAAGLRDAFRFVTMSVTVRTNSQDANAVPRPAEVNVAPPTIDERRVEPTALTDDEDYW